jgi:soluble lytic murein transglycosylase
LRLSIKSFLFGLLAAVSVTATARAALSDHDLALYRQAYTDAQGGQWDDAWAAASEARDRFPAKLLLWIELVRDPPQVRFGQIRNFLEANPTWPDQLLLRRHAEALLHNEGDAAAADWFAHFRPLSTAGKVRQADLMMASGHGKEGIARLREIWATANFAPSEERDFLAHYGDYLQPDDQARRLDRLLWDGNDAAARRMLPRVNPSAGALGAARLALLTNAPNAEHLTEMVPPTLQNDPGLIFARLRWLRHRERYNEAITLLDHPPANPVRPLAWAGERQILARLALSEGNASLAYRLANNSGLTSGPAFGELEFLAGWVALRFLHDPAEGYRHFVQLYDHSKMSVSKARGAYWAARAAAAMHPSGDAAGWYDKAASHPMTYYGQLAAAAIHQPGIGQIAPEPDPDQAQTLAFESRDLVKAARDLVAMGDGDDARPFLARLLATSTSPGDDVLVARLALALDRPDIEMMAARHAANDGVALFAESYPMVTLPPGGAAEPALVLAMTRQESGFDPGAVSLAGARGMMQLMPATAKKLADRFDLPFSRTRLTNDRVYNLRLGRAYLDQMLDRFDGSYVLAIAAYNAGPARVHHWLAQFGDPRTPGTNVIDWIEALPVAETRNYLQRVLENLQIYRFRMGDRDLAFRLAADLKR